MEHKRGNMTDSEKKTSVASSFRKPKPSTAVDRKRVARPSRTMMSSEMTMKSSGLTREQIIRQQMQAQQMAKMQAEQAMMQTKQEKSRIKQAEQMQQKSQAQQQVQMQQQAQAQQQSQMQQQAQAQQMSQAQQKQQMTESQQMSSSEQSKTPQIQTQRMQSSLSQSVKQETMPKSEMVQRFASSTEQKVEMKSTEQSEKEDEIIRHAIAESANARMQQRMSSQPTPVKETAKQIKETAIEKALASASRKKSADEKQESGKIHFGFKRVLLAMACAAACVAAVVFFVNLNSPNISLKVAAMQTGIEASYPAYVPRDYTLSDIMSENGKVTLNFKNGNDDTLMTLVEEKSSWDSNALLNNYVRYEYGDDYTTMREQGLTIYISSSNATWVNGGVVYKLTAPNNALTKKQIKSIAVSL